MLDQAPQQLTQEVAATESTAHEEDMEQGAQEAEEEAEEKKQQKREPLSTESFFAMGGLQFLEQQQTLVRDFHSIVAVYLVYVHILVTYTTLPISYWYDSSLLLTG